MYLLQVFIYVNPTTKYTIGGGGFPKKGKERAATLSLSLLFILYCLGDLQEIISYHILFVHLVQ
jgi:hypothetical protein